MIKGNLKLEDRLKCTLGFPIYAWSLSQRSCKLPPAKSISQGTDSITQAMNPRDLRKNALLNQTSWPGFETMSS